MTLDQALEKADRQMDDIFARVLCDAEEFIRDLGGTDDECAAFFRLVCDARARRRRLGAQSQSDV